MGFVASRILEASIIFIGVVSLLSIGTLFGLHDQVSATASLLALPVAAWELSLGIWMTVKGFKAVPTTEEAPIPNRTPAYSGSAA